MAAPDYRASVADLFTRFTLQLIETLKSLQILDVACSNKDGLPPWVPDFTRPGAYPYPSGADASTSWTILRPMTQPRPGKISVPVLAVDRVAAVPEAPDLVWMTAEEHALARYDIWQTNLRRVQDARLSNANELDLSSELADTDEF